MTYKIAKRRRFHDPGFVAVVVKEKAPFRFCQRKLRMIHPGKVLCKMPVAKYPVPSETVDINKPGDFFTINKDMARISQIS